MVLTCSLGAVDAEEVVVPPQDPVGVAQAHTRDHRRPIDEAARAVQRLHVQASPLYNELAMLRLDSETGELDVG